MIKETRDQKGITLQLDNGDSQKFDECMRKWSFRDAQSFLRFAVSIMLVTEDKSLWIKASGQQQPIAPAKEFLKE